MSAAALAERLANVANLSTLRLTHYGRRSGKPYEVTIWFLVERDTVYLVTANRQRQWPRNVAVRPAAHLRIGGESFAGQVEEITNPATIEHVKATYLGETAETLACRLARHRTEVQAWFTRSC